MWHDIEQNTDEWLEMRAGKVTGSAISTIMANFGKAFGEPAKKYAIDIANERMKGSAIVGDRYTNKHMEAGHVEEPIARMLYQDYMMSQITNGGFYDNGNTGCSPDGLVGINGLVEIKSVIPSVHFKAVKDKQHDSKYKWQIAFNLRESGREWCDYISFCEQFYKPKQLEIIRISKDDVSDLIAMIDERLSEFELLVKKNMEIIAR